MRELRNDFEHLDERLRNQVTSSRSRPLTIDQFDGVSTIETVNSRATRSFNPDTLCVSLLGHRYDLLPCQQELAHISDRALSAGWSHLDWDFPADKPYAKHRPSRARFPREWVDAAVDRRSWPGAPKKLRAYPLWRMGMFAALTIERGTVCEMCKGNLLVLKRERVCNNCDIRWPENAFPVRRDGR
jgi:hypothetical protein